MKIGNRFLNAASKSERLNVAIDARVSVLCGIPDAVSLLRLAPPPHFTTVKYFASQGRFRSNGNREFSDPRAAFCKVLYSGFLCCIADDSNERFPSRCNFFV